MKRNVQILVGLVIVTIVGGVMTSNLGFTVPVIRQTADPAASLFAAPPGQALGFLLWILFVLGSLFGMGAGIAAALVFLNRERKVVAEMPTRSELEAGDDA